MKLAIELNLEKGNVAIMLHEEPHIALSCDVCDTTGKSLQTLVISDPMTIVELSAFEQAELILRIHQKNKLIKSFRIVRH